MLRVLSLKSVHLGDYPDFSLTAGRDGFLWIAQAFPRLWRTSGPAILAPYYTRAQTQGRASGQGWNPDRNACNVMSAQSLRIFGVQIEEYDGVGQGRGSYIHQFTQKKQWMSALVSYSGNMEGWTLSPPYLAPSRIRGGIKRPNETATIKFIGKPLGIGG